MNEILKELEKNIIVPVVVLDDAKDAENLAKALVQGGLPCAEVTFRTDAAEESIRIMCEKFPEMCVGAGTVLTTEQVDRAMGAGAKFIVSPGLNPETVKLCNRYRVPMLPGVMTPTEAITALELGCDIIKVFPGNIVGPAAISSFRGPLPQGEFMPSGGVDVDNVEKWLKAGACAVGTGSNLTAGAKKGDYAAVTAKAQEFVKAVADARANLAK